MTALGRERSGAEPLTATGRVPVEHRFFGLDRRSLLPGLVVIGLFVLWAVVIPVVNDALQYSQQTRAGDVFRLAKGLTMNAQPGWGVDSGLLTTDTTQNQSSGETVALNKGGVTFVVSTGPFRGDERTLLSQIKKVDDALSGQKVVHISAATTTFHTDQGHRGIAQGYATVGGMGVIAALVYGDTGVKSTVTGSSAAMSDQSDEVESMIDSIHYDAEASR